MFESPPDTPIPAKLLELYRQATPTRKLEVVARLNATLIELKSSYLKSLHPDWAPAELNTALRRWWFSARD